MRKIYAFAAILFTLSASAYCKTVAISKFGDLLTIVDSSGKSVSFPVAEIYTSPIGFDEANFPFDEISIDSSTATDYQYFKIINKDGTETSYKPNW